MTTEEKLLKTPVIRWFVQIFQKIKIPGLEGMTLYNLLEMYISGIIRGAFTARAGSIAFSFFIALFPFALFILTLIPFVPIEGFQDDFLSFIFKTLPSDESREAVSHVLEDIAINKYGGLLSFGFLLSIFLMTNGVNAVFSSFENTYHNIKTRSVVKQYLISLIVSLVLAFLLLVTVGVIVFLGLLIRSLDQQGIVTDAPFWIGIVQIIILLLMVLISISILYYFGTRDGNKISFFSPGTLLTTILFIVNFKIFGIYIDQFAQYNKLYGSIGTLLVIMLFIWLNSIILLLGFELNTSLFRLQQKNQRKIAFQNSKNN